MIEISVAQFEKALEKGNLIYFKRHLVNVTRNVIGEKEVNIPVILVEKVNIHTKERIKHLKVDYENTETVTGKIFAGKHTLTEVMIPNKRRRMAIFRTVIA